MFVPTVERGNDKAEKTRDDVQIYYISQITYLKSDYYVGRTAISYNLPRFLTDINNYKNLFSITLTLFNGDHLEQILNLSFESRQKLKCLKLDRFLDIVYSTQRAALLVK
ncbi:unnamed protein product, partial [Didymodactylos carnosus]